MDSEFLSNEDYAKKVEQNKFPIIDKDYIELSETELQKFINEAKTSYFYYKKDGVNVANAKLLYTQFRNQTITYGHTYRRF